MFPVADPTLASSAKKIQEASFVQSIIANPGVDPKKATKFIVTSSGIPDIEQILVDEKEQQPPNPEAVKIQAEIQNLAETVKLKQADLELKKEELKLQERTNGFDSRTSEKYTARLRRIFLPWG